jgi:hypothetical protein
MVANWVLDCVNCKMPFVHSPIDVREALDYFLPAKPEFPGGGSEFRCPQCGHVATYQRSDLSYQS